MRKIINDPADFVGETIEGILLAHPGELKAVTLDLRALVRGDAPRTGKVAIVTGGGSGHLPVFLGYVGPGLLDGVAVGNVFSSPSSAQIAAATRAVDGGAGVLYLYGNYGGDVYNFEIAGDLVAADGIRTRTVLAADDVASAPAESRETRRGVAGMVFAFKLAGAAAERGYTLDQVAAIATRAGRNTRTMGVGLSPTILPAAGEPTFTIDDGDMEIGIGIHGEPGIHRGRLESADLIADRLLDEILDDLNPVEGATVSVLVNGMGATPLEELYVLYRRVHHRLAERGIGVYSPFVGNYVTSLEMAGASISVIVLDDELRELLDAPAASPFFRHGGDISLARQTPGFTAHVAPKQAPDVSRVAPKQAPDAAHVAPKQAPDAADGGTGTTAPDAAADGTRTDEPDAAIDDTPTALAALLLDVLDRLPAHAAELRDLDAALGDGDLGITVAAGARAARAAIALDPSATDRTLLGRVGLEFSSANPSTFAALVGGGIIFASGRLDRDTLGDARSIASWANDVQEKIAERGGAQLGDKTILDALAPSIAVLESNADATTSELLDLMLNAVDEAIDETTPLLSAKGRAAWLRERSAGLVDPGMAAYRALLAELRAALGR